MYDTIKKDFFEIFSELNEFLVELNKEADLMGGSLVKKQVIKIVGQVALLLAELPFPVGGTSNLDLISNLEHQIQKKLIEILGKKGITLDSDGHLIWMPPDTKFEKIFDLSMVEVWIAEPDAVILSKYKFNRTKDRELIKTYLKFFPAIVEKMKEIIK